MPEFERSNVGQIERGRVRTSVLRLTYLMVVEADLWARCDGVRALFVHTWHRAYNPTSLRTRTVQVRARNRFCEEPVLSVSLAVLSVEE
jgi:hypothetical protein